LSRLHGAIDEPKKLTDEDEYAPESMPDVESFMNTENSLAGRYKGALITYDWSGKQIVRNENIEIAFSKSGNVYNGTWIQGSDTLAVTGRLSDDGILTFSDSRISMVDRYRDNRKISCIFDDATLALVGSSLTGSVRMFSFADNEPLRPMYIALSRISDTDTDKDPYRCAIEAYPVPGTGQAERYISIKIIKSKRLRRHVERTMAFYSRIIHILAIERHYFLKHFLCFCGRTVRINSNSFTIAVYCFTEVAFLSIVITFSIEFLCCHL